MKKYVEINSENIEFKNLLSGPAQVGRILNYIIYAGEGMLRHKPGNRNDLMENSIGSAWCIEFMIGLGLIELDSRIGDSNVYNTRLTSSGNKIYNILVENAIGPDFNHDSNPEKTLEYLEEKNALNIVNVFEEVFRNTIIFKDLCIFLDIKNITADEIIVKKDDFMEGIFGELCEYYTNTPYLRNGSGASTAGNRVPSLLQLLYFLKYAYLKNGEIHFVKDSIINGIFDENYKLDISDEHLIAEYEKEEKIIEKLAKEFGIAGNHIVNEVVRLSQTQLIFKERLKREHGCHCWLCGIENEALLIASHIQDASKSNIHEKADNNNGLLLCAQHDKLFDSGLISFDFQTGKIMISKLLNEEDRRLTNINENMKLNEELMTNGRREYLIWHNNNFLSGKNE